MHLVAVPDHGPDVAALGPIADSAGSISKVYKIHDKLGNGAFGCVSRATHIASGTPAAVKTVARKRQKISYADAEKADLYECLRRARQKDAARLREEIDIMKRLGGESGQQHVVKLLDTFEDQDNMHLCMELCSGGELIDFMLQAKVFTEMHASIVMQQILEGVAYMHQKRVVHRDVKPENTLLALPAPLESNVVKLSDFGLSCVCGAGETMKQPCGTISYIAPQVLLQSYTNAADLWSCGVVAYLLLCGILPFRGRKDEALIARIKRGNYAFSSSGWNKVSEDAKSFIRELLRHSQEERATAKDALQHDWIRDCEPRLPDCSLQNVLDNLQKYYRMPSADKEKEKDLSPQAGDPAAVDWENMSVVSGVSLMSTVTTGWFESATYATSYVTNGAAAAFAAVKGAMSTAAPQPSASGLASKPKPPPLQVREQPPPDVVGVTPGPSPISPDKSELLFNDRDFADFPVDEDLPVSPPAGIPKPFLVTPSRGASGGRASPGVLSPGGRGVGSCQTLGRPCVAGGELDKVGNDDSQVDVVELRYGTAGQADGPDHAAGVLSGAAGPTRPGMYKGKPVEFFSQSHNSWIPCAIVAVNESGAVMVSAKRGAWIAKGDQADRIREQRVATEPRSPLGSDGSGSEYQQGQTVEYNSATAGKWIAAQVINRDVAGNIMLSVKPGVWLSHAKQAERVRVVQKDEICEHTTEDRREDASVPPRDDLHMDERNLRDVRVRNLRL